MDMGGYYYGFLPLNFAASVISHCYFYDRNMIANGLCFTQVSRQFIAKQHHVFHLYKMSDCAAFQIEKFALWHGHADHRFRRQTKLCTNGE